jgi:thymidylate synthase
MKTKCLTTIENGFTMSRVHAKLMGVEAQRLSIESVIWSNLYGDIQQWFTTGVVLRTALNIVSADTLLGLPYNIASYALLTHLLAYECGLNVGDLIWVGGDCHLYNNHREGAVTMLARECRLKPTLHIAKDKSLFTFTEDDMWLVGYAPHPPIKLPIAV